MENPWIYWGSLTYPRVSENVIQVRCAHDPPPRLCVLRVRVPTGTRPHPDDLAVASVSTTVVVHFWGPFGVVLGSFWGHLLGSFLGRFGVFVGPGVSVVCPGAPRCALERSLGVPGAPWERPRPPREGPEGPKCAPRTPQEVQESQRRAPGTLGGSARSGKTRPKGGRGNLQKPLAG